jgi:hypothetical protein
MLLSNIEAERRILNCIKYLYLDKTEEIRIFESWKNYCPKIKYRLRGRNCATNTDRLLKYARDENITSIHHKYIFPEDHLK